jgi:hypothetical protein
MWGLPVEVDRFRVLRHHRQPLWADIDERYTFRSVGELLNVKSYGYPF